MGGGQAACQPWKYHPLSARKWGRVVFLGPWGYTQLCLYHWQDGGILLHLVLQWMLESNALPGGFPSLQPIASEAGRPGGSRAAGPGEEKVARGAGTHQWEGGEHPLLAETLAKGNWMVTVVLPLMSVLMVGVKPSQGGLRRGREGCPAQQPGWEIMISFL